jgi:hypothetical protein
MGKSSVKLEEKNVYKDQNTMTWYQNQQTSIITPPPPTKKQNMGRHRNERKRAVNSLNRLTY